MMFAPLLAQGQELITIYDQTDSERYKSLADLFPGTTSSKSALAIIFTAEQTAYLTQVTTSIYKHPAAVATLTMAITNYTGTISGTTGDTAYPLYPSQVAYETSNTIYSSDIVNSVTEDMTQTFQFNGTYLMTAGQNYSLILYVSGMTHLEPSYDFILVRVGDTDATNAGATYHNGGWQAAQDVMTLDVYGQAEAATTPIPTVTASPTASSGNWIDDQYGATNEGIAFLTDYMPVFVPLILILVCGFLGYYFAGAWGFFAGFNIGTILAFTFGYLELWAIVLIAVIDAVLIFGNIKLGKGV